MGVGLSLELASSLSIVRTWSWERVTEIVDTFLKEECDFNMENRAVEKLTGMNSAEADALVVALTRRVDAQVNGITLLVSLILLAEESSASVEERTALVYKLMDFDGSGEITMEEMGIILFCLAMATSFILQRHKLCPTALEVKQINESIFEKMGKQFTSCVSKEEFMAWSETVTQGQNTTVFDIYKYFVSATGNEAMKKDADKAEAEEAQHKLKQQESREKEEAKLKEKEKAEEEAKLQAEHEASEKEAARLLAEREAAEREAARLLAEREAADREAAKKVAEEEAAQRIIEEKKEQDTSSSEKLKPDEDANDFVDGQYGA